MPSLEMPQGLNRYSYGLNNPVKYLDPSGHDPIDAQWEIDLCGSAGCATDEQRQDYLFSLMFLGSGVGNAWTQGDWDFYRANRAALWAGTTQWLVYEAPGLDRFTTHLQRLGSYCSEGEEEQFVRAIGLVWGGVAYGLGYRNAAAALVEAARGGSGLQDLYEGNGGWDESIVDDRNPARHWAGAFVGGWYAHEWAGKGLNTGREAASVFVRGASFDDVWLGNIASQHANSLWKDSHGIIVRPDRFTALAARLDEDLGSGSPACFFCGFTQQWGWSTPKPSR